MLKGIPVFFSFSIFRSLFFETNKTKIQAASGIVYIAGPYIVPNRQCDFKETQARTLCDQLNFLGKFSNNQIVSDKMEMP